jgi:hypothetical protein
MHLPEKAPRPKALGIAHIDLALLLQINLRYVSGSARAKPQAKAINKRNRG